MAPTNLWRVDSFFGNPVFYAAYLIVAFLIGLGLYLTPNNRRDSVKKGLWNVPWLVIFCGICLLVAFWGFCLANTRGCYLGLAGGIIVFLCLAGRELLSKYRIRLTLVGLGIVIIFGYYNIITQEYSVIKRFETIYSVPSDKETDGTSPSIGATPTVSESRIPIWKTTAKIIKDYPYLGIGPETLGLIYPRYFHKTFPQVYEPMEEVADRVHNDFLDNAVSRGLIGLTVYLWGLLAFFTLCWRFYKHSSLADRPIFIGFISAAVGFLIQNQFSFSVPETSCSIAMLIAGMVVYERQSLIPSTQASSQDWTRNIYPYRKILSWTYYLIMVCAFSLFFIFISRLYLADRHYLLGKSSANIDVSIKEYQQAVAFHPYDSKYYGQLNKAYFDKALRVPGNFSYRRLWTKESEDRIKKFSKHIPDHASSYFMLGFIEYILSKDVNDPRIEKAMSYYEKSLELNPFLKDAEYNMAVIYYKQKRYDQAIKHFTRVYQLEGDNMAAIYRLAEIFAIKGKFEEARKYLRKLQEIDPEYPTARLQKMISNQRFSVHG